MRSRSAVRVHLRINKCRERCAAIPYDCNVGTLHFAPLQIGKSPISWQIKEGREPSQK